MSRPPQPQAFIFGNWCFVPSPMPGLWVRTHISVAFVDCPDCGAAVFASCRHKGKVVGWAHASRRRDGAEAVREGKSRTVMHAMPEVPLDELE